MAAHVRVCVYVYVCVGEGKVKTKEIKEMHMGADIITFDTFKTSTFTFHSSSCIV